MNLIIAGAAPCVFDDLLEAMNFVVDVKYDFMAIGLDAVCNVPSRIKYMTTYHPEDIPSAKERRGKLGGNTDYAVISHLPGDGIDIVEPHRDPTGSSALLGVFAARKLGYGKIILCGCPMEGLNVLNHPYENFHEGWRRYFPEVSRYVRSMSGWTRTLLGEPTEEWLHE